MPVALMFVQIRPLGGRLQPNYGRPSFGHRFHFSDPLEGPKESRPCRRARSPSAPRAPQSAKQPQSLPLWASRRPALSYLGRELAPSDHGPLEAGGTTGRPPARRVLQSSSVASMMLAGSANSFALAVATCRCRKAGPHWSPYLATAWTSQCLACCAPRVSAQPRPSFHIQACP